jgi:hypothetical protein
VITLHVLTIVSAYGPGSPRGTYAAVEALVRVLEPDDALLVLPDGDTSRTSLRILWRKLSQRYRPRRLLVLEDENSQGVWVYRPVEYRALGYAIGPSMEEAIMVRLRAEAADGGRAG